MRFPEFTDIWETKKLGSLVEIKSGISPTNIIDEEGKIPYFKVDQLNSSEKYLSSFNTPYFTRSHKDVIKANSVIFPKRGAAIMTNKVRIIEQDSLIDTNLMSIICNETQRLNNEYLYYFILNKQLSRIADTSTIPQLNNIHINPIPFPLPNIIEQNKIATFFSLLDQRIETQNKIIGKLESLIKGILHGLEFKGRQKETWQYLYLRDILTERRERNANNYPVFSVSVSKGIINQIEYLGRSFAAKDTQNYNLVHNGDIVYTKSPTGKFLYGIIKQSFIESPVAVSPLYGVYSPINKFVGNYLHYYFKNPRNANNYLHSLIQKGAKNTINITNQHFLDKKILLPGGDEITLISNLLNDISCKITLEESVSQKLIAQKTHLLSLMFI